ncbi:MAG: PhaM family polyhydroxyalkanoate granule multifunctional regulatory protein [Betaproteobacteria bacterium]
MPTDRPTPPLMPGFDFLKTLAAQAGAGFGVPGAAGAGATGGTGAMSGLGGFQQWVSPTLDPDELDKRIEELRTVQFWLEQNARLLGATIQALEVQKMTLSTLRGMNVHMPDLQQMLGAMMPTGAAGASAKPSAAHAPTPTPAPDAPRPSRPDAAKPSGAAAGLVDPMKWWGALTEQFQTLAAQALATPPAQARAPAKPGKAAPNKPRRQASAAAKAGAPAATAPRTATKRRAAR